MSNIQLASRPHGCFGLTDFSDESTENGSFIHWNDSPASFHIILCKQWFLLLLLLSAVLVTLPHLTAVPVVLLLLVLAILLMAIPAVLLLPTVVPATRLLRVPAILRMAVPVALLLLTEARVIPLLLMADLAILLRLPVVLATTLRIPLALVCLLPLVATEVVTKRYSVCMCLLKSCDYGGSSMISSAILCNVHHLGNVSKDHTSKPV